MYYPPPGVQPGPPMGAPAYPPPGMQPVGYGYAPPPGPAPTSITSRFGNMFSGKKACAQCGQPAHKHKALCDQCASRSQNGSMDNHSFEWGDMRVANSGSGGEAQTQSFEWSKSF
eukprot:NODE_2127_length_633_cov_276.823630_g1673_i0.p1 GENE.NODE_2127_length_633_cov_276.823630_g1673_i0~~NODE_2127_length_633_cov_276.823630_g1673_i0.p1  ORF type:complete len:133 (-),score=32.41 NODE_2127_length_633_cov_276.823630_g1673_i0:233-577(-)